MAGLLTPEALRDALRACYDTANPYGRPINIVDLGLVERIDLALDPEAPGAGIPGVPPRQSLQLTLLRTSPNPNPDPNPNPNPNPDPNLDPDPNPDPDQSQAAQAQLAAQMAAQIANLLAGLPQLSHARVLFSDEPPWTPERISAEGRRLLGLEPEPFPILNNRRR